MRRAGPLALLPALLLAVPSALAETCSRSTLASPDFAFARWCGDPATTGTLRVARRDGRATDYLAVPAAGLGLAFGVAAARAEPPLPLPPVPPPR